MIYDVALQVNQTMQIFELLSGGACGTQLQGALLNELQESYAT